MEKETSFFRQFLSISKWNQGLFVVFLGLIGIIIYDQLFYWGNVEDYSFGYLTFFFVGYVFLDRWGIIYEVLRQEPLPQKEKKIFASISVLASLGQIFSLVVFLLGALIRVGQGPTALASLLLTLGFAGIVFSTTYLIASNRFNGANAFRKRLAFVGLFFFPAMAWILSAPMVMFMATTVRVYLQEVVVVIVSFIFNALGFFMVREGSILIFEKGQVGIADACTGIRSLMGCFFAGSFLAALFLENWVRKTLFLLIAGVIAFFMNILRSLFLTAWAYNYGSEAINGKVHDIAAYSVLGATAICLLVLIPLFSLRWFSPSTDES